MHPAVTARCRKSRVQLNYSRIVACPQTDVPISRGAVFFSAGLSHFCQPICCSGFCCNERGSRSIVVARYLCRRQKTRSIESDRVSLSVQNPGRRKDGAIVLEIETLDRLGWLAYCMCDLPISQKQSRRPPDLTLGRAQISDISNVSA